MGCELEYSLTPSLPHRHTLDLFVIFAVRWVIAFLCFEKVFNESTAVVDLVATRGLDFPFLHLRFNDRVSEVIGVVVLWAPPLSLIPIPRNTAHKTGVLVPGGR